LPGSQEQSRKKSEKHFYLKPSKDFKENVGNTFETINQNTSRILRVVLVWIYLIHLFMLNGQWQHRNKLKIIIWQRLFPLISSLQINRGFSS